MSLLIEMKDGSQHFIPFRCVRLDGHFYATENGIDFDELPLHIDLKRHRFVIVIPSGHGVAGSRIPEMSTRMLFWSDYIKACREANLRGLGPENVIDLGPVFRSACR